MTQIVGGHNLGLLFGSYSILNRSDTTGMGTMGHGEQSFANVSNGNLILQSQDIFLPSLGHDFELIRTYNSRGRERLASGRLVVLDQRHVEATYDDHPITGPNQRDYSAFYGDGTEIDFVYDPARQFWVSTDGAGAYETLQALDKPGADGVQYTITRADRSKYRFDKDFNLLSIADNNGVTTTFTYKGNDLIKVNDDSGHVLTFTYTGGRLSSISDETLQTLVQYAYTGSDLTSVTDRAGHVTTYHYNKDHLIDSITMPSTQVVNGQTQTFETRTVSFQYQKIHWDDHPYWSTEFDTGDAWTLTQITDGNGQITSFEYNFQFANGVNAPNDRDLPFKPNGGQDFLGGSTRVVDALGNARAYSNLDEFRAWRRANGYYDVYTNYDPKTQAAQLAAQTAQAEAIRSKQAVTYTYDANGQLTGITDERGLQTLYTYDFNGNVTSITDANGFGAANSDSDYFRKLRADLGYTDVGGLGKLVATLTAADKAAILAKFTSRFTYDNNGNLLTSTDNAGNVTTYTYTAFNKVASITTALGHVTTYAYDANQNLTRRIDGLGNIIDFQYDASGDLTKKIVYLDKTDLVTASKQEVTQYFYDAFGDNTRVTDAEGNNTFRTYDHLGNVLTSTDGRGGVTTYVYDKDNQLLQVTTPEGSKTSYAYDAVGNRIAVTDANGHTVTQVFDKNNMLLTTIDPSATNALQNRNTQILYDVLGNSTKTTDAEGRVTLYTYDAHRQLIDIQTDQVKNASDQLVTYHETFAYDGLSNVVVHTDNNGNVSQYLYNAVGLLKRVTDPTGNITEYLYNADLKQATVTIGAQLSVASGLRRVLSFSYDNEDQLTSEIDALHNVKSYAYDAAGNVVAVTDERHNTTNFEFDRNNRMLREIRPAVVDPGTHVLTRYVVSHKYDADGNEIETTDERGNKTLVAFDKDNRIVLLTDADGVQTVFSYDSRNNQTQVAIGVVAHMDASSHVVIDSVGSSHVTTYVYDEFNQLVAMTDGVGNALVTSDDALYQAMRTKLGFAAMVSGLSASNKDALRELYTEHYTYDRVGNRVTSVDHQDHVTTTVYDALNRVVAVTEGVGTGVERTTTYRYDGNDNLVKTDSPLGRETTVKYDGMNRVIERKDALGTITRSVYDNVGNLISQTEAYGTSQERTTQYVYDLDNRVTQQFDALGYARAFSNDAEFVAWRTANGYYATYNAADSSQLSQVATIRSVQSVLFAYDEAGNLVTRTSGAGLPAAQRRVERFEYDVLGRLVAQVDGANVRTEFTYDAAGNKIKTTVAPGQAEQRVNAFEYDADSRLTAEIDGNGVRTEYRYDATDNKIEVIQAAGRAGEERHTLMTYDADDRLVSITDPKVLTTRYQYDSLGNQTVITDADGTVTLNTFDALGRLLTNTVGSGGPHGGIRTTNTFDAFDNILTTTQTWADGSDARTTTYEYDKLDRQTAVIDGEGSRTEFEYDAFGNQTRIRRGIFTADLTRQHILDTHLTYDKLDRLLTTTDGRGNQVQDTYDALGNRVMQTTGVSTGADAAHVSTLIFVYDLAGRVIERDSPTGGVVMITYDGAGNQHSIWTLQSGPNDLVTGTWSKKTFAYDGNGRAIASTDSYGTITEYHFDAVGNLTSVVSAKGTSDERTVAFEYDLDNNKTASIDAKLARTTFAYDAAGNLVKTTDALGRVTRFYFDAFHRMSGELDARNFLTTFTYDAAGNVTQTLAYANAVAGTVADNAPQPSAVADASHDRLTSSIFDRANRVNQVTAPDGSYKTYQYDSTDRLLRQTQYGAPSLLSRTALQTPRVQTWQYDDSGRMVKFTNVDGTTETYAYDAANNKISQTVHNPQLLAGGRTDPDRTTTFTYDLDNRLISQLFDPAGQQLLQQLAYDKAGNVVRKTDANSHATSTQFDLENRAVGVTDALGQSITFGYDRVGNQVQVTDANGNTITTVYDKNNRATQVIMPQVSVTTLAQGAHSVTPTTTTTYDAVGNIVQITDARGYITTRWYDATDDLIAERAGDGGSNASARNGIVRTYSYDAFGEVLAATLDMNVPYRCRSTSPRRRCLTSTVHAATNVYDLAGRVTMTQYSAITVTTVNYANAANPALNAATTATVTPQELSYYDAFGNLVESVDRNGNHSYAYFDLRGRQVAAVDACGYLIETDYDDFGRVVEQRKYATKLTGPFSAATRPVAPAGTPATIDRIYDTAGRLTDEISPAVRTAATGTQYQRVVTHFTYDAVGNVTSKSLGYATIVGAVRTPPTGRDANARTEYYFYDAANRRVAVVGADRVINQFGFDGNGNTTMQKRIFAKLASGFNLDTATLASIQAQALALADATKDEETDFQYDSANRQVRKTDLMGVGTADDIVNVSAYDEAGNLTYRRNLDVATPSQMDYDAFGHVVETVAPNGSHSFVQYDAGGLKIRAWTGGAPGSSAPVATIVGATVSGNAGGGLVITWNQPGSNMTSWVAWDTVDSALGAYWHQYAIDSAPVLRQICTRMHRATRRRQATA